MIEMEKPILVLRYSMIQGCAEECCSRDFASEAFRISRPGASEMMLNCSSRLFYSSMINVFR
jgi:hypothetical protein